MKALSCTLFAVLLLAAAQPAQADTSVEVNISFFHERLSPHGHWVELEGHGWCWQPRVIAVGWRPYLHGRWVYMDDCGWYWHTDEAWGWACYHYGRWTWVGSRWYWVPGTEWAGAWVVWRNGGGYVGWAPLPPRATFEVGVGIRAGSVDFEADIHAHSWAFVAHADFVHPRIHSVVIKDDVEVVIRKAPVAGSISVKGGVVLNHAITLDAAAKFTGKPITPHKVRAAATLGAAGLAAGEGEVRVFRPRVKGGDAKPPRPDDAGRAAEAARKTMNERHEAEDRELKERHGRPDGDEQRGRAEREEMEKRHRRDRDEFEKAHGKPREAPDKPDRPEPRESPDKPDRPEPRKPEPDKPDKPEPDKPDKPEPDKPDKPEPRRPGGNGKGGKGGGKGR